jgi:large subunit ribosomal protein L9
MEVILREHVDNLGRRGEIVKVADGYARNFLLPRKLALLATEGNKKQIERERAKFEAKEAEEQKVADAQRDRLANIEVVSPSRSRRSARSRSPSSCTATSSRS